MHCFKKEVSQQEVYYTAAYLLRLCCSSGYLHLAKWSARSWIPCDKKRNRLSVIANLCPLISIFGLVLGKNSWKHVKLSKTLRNSVAISTFNLEIATAQEHHRKRKR